MLRPALGALVELCHGHSPGDTGCPPPPGQVTDSEAGSERWVDARAVLTGEVAGEMEAARRVFDPYECPALYPWPWGEFPPWVALGNHVQQMFHASAG